MELCTETAGRQIAGLVGFIRPPPVQSVDDYHTSQSRAFSLVDEMRIDEAAGDPARCQKSLRRDYSPPVDESIDALGFRLLT